MVFYLFLLVSSVISLTLAVLLFRRRHIPGAYGLILVISLTFLQILGFILEWLSRSMEGKLFWDNFQFVPLILLPLANFAFIFGFTHPRWTTLGLAVLPAANRELPAEDGIEANNQTLEVLYQMALDLANLPQDNDLFEFLAYRLKEIAGAQSVILTEYNPKQQCLETRYITMDEEVLAEIGQLLHFDIKQLSMPYSGEFQQNLLKKSVIFETSIFDATLELVPQPVSDVLHQTFGIGEVIVLALGYQGHLLGAALLFMSIGIPRPAEKMLLALSRVATIAFRKRSAEIARLESENRFREFAELVPQPVLEYNLEGQITFASRKTFQNLGYTREDLEAGLNVLNMVRESERAQLRGKLRKLAAGETLFGNEYTLLSKDARLVPVLAYSSPVLTGQQVTGGRTVLIDISDRKAAEQVLERYARRMEMLHQIDHSILSSHSAEEIAQAALNGIKKMVPITVAHIFLVDPPSGRSAPWPGMAPQAEATARS